MSIPTIPSRVELPSLPVSINLRTWLSCCRQDRYASFISSYNVQKESYLQSMERIHGLPFESAYPDYHFQDLPTETLYNLLRKPPVSLEEVDHLIQVGAKPNNHHLMAVLYKDFVGYEHQVALLEKLISHGARPDNSVVESFFANHNNPEFLPKILYYNSEKIAGVLSNDVVDKAVALNFPVVTIQQLFAYGAKPSNITHVFARTPEMKAFIQNYPGSSSNPPTPIFDCLADVITWIVDKVSSLCAYIKSLFCCKC